MVAAVKNIIVSPKESSELLKQTYEGMSAEGDIERQLEMMENIQKRSQLEELASKVEGHKAYNRFMVKRGKTDKLVNFNDHIDVAASQQLFDRHVQILDEDASHEFAPHVMQLDLNHHLSGEELARTHDCGSVTECDGQLQLAEEEEAQFDIKEKHGRKL